MSIFEYFVSGRSSVGPYVTYSEILGLVEPRYDCVIEKHDWKGMS